MKRKNRSQTVPLSSGAPAGKVATAILMSGTGSNARKILEYLPFGREEPCYEVRLIVSDNPASNYRRIADEHGLPARLNDIYEFCGVPQPQVGLSLDQRARLRDQGLRRAFDARTDRILKQAGVRLVALAGYDWVLSPSICRGYVVVNVHPGDLRRRDERGKRLYVGLGWVPAAKAVLNGERFVHSTTHLVTSELDGGPIARVSRPVPVELPEGIAPADLLPQGATLQEVIRDVSRGGALASCPLVHHCRSLQERLKEQGDWVEFSRTLDQVAALMLSGRLEREEAGRLLLDGQPVADLFLQEERGASAGRGAAGRT